MKRLQWSLAWGVLALFCSLGLGCNSSPKDDNAKQPLTSEVTLNVLVVEGPEIASNAGRRWSAEGMGNANFTQISKKDFAKSDFKLESAIDVVVYPAEYMADLVAAGQLMTIPKKFLDNDTTNRREMLPHQTKFLQRYGSDVFTLPLGDTFLMLLYNQKVFEELNLEVPKTWGEYAEVAERLRDAGHAVQEPFAGGWASRLLLSRAAAYVRSQGKVSTVFEINSMKPLILDEPFPRVFAELRASLGEAIDTELTPAGVYLNLLKGDAAMGLCWPSKHFSNDDSPVNEDIAVAMLPGARQWYNRLESVWEERDKESSIRMPLIGSTGMVVSVNRSSGYASTAIEFATWLCSKQTSTSVSIESPHVSMFRATHLGLPSRWTGEKISPVAAEEFGDVVRETSESQIVFLFPRIPGQAEYLNSLDRHVIEFAKGEVTAEAALEETVKNWNEITERLNRSDQVRMLRRSEGFTN